MLAHGMLAVRLLVGGKPSYEFLTEQRGPLCALRDKVSDRVVFLVDWPGSLLDMWRAGVLGPKARAEVDALWAP